MSLFGLLAAMSFLIAAVWAIWKIDKFTSKLIALTAFVVGFTLWVAFLTNATRMELFGATAAYAAVLVVYVGKG